MAKTVYQLSNAQIRLLKRQNHEVGFSYKLLDTLHVEPVLKAPYRGAQCCSKPYVGSRAIANLRQTDCKRLG